MSTENTTTNGHNEAEDNDVVNNPSKYTVLPEHKNLTIWQVAKLRVLDDMSTDKTPVAVAINDTPEQLRDKLSNMSEDEIDEYFATVKSAPVVSEKTAIRNSLDRAFWNLARKLGPGYAEEISDSALQRYNPTAWQAKQKAKEVREARAAKKAATEAKNAK